LYRMAFKRRLKRPIGNAIRSSAYEKKNKIGRA
jgi:hypothetical protein